MIIIVIIIIIIIYQNFPWYFSWNSDAPHNLGFKFQIAALIMGDAPSTAVLVENLFSAFLVLFIDIYLSLTAAAAAPPPPPPIIYRHCIILVFRVMVFVTKLHDKWRCFRTQSSPSRKESRTI